MQVDLVPLLHVQRGLLDIPRGMQRFDAYKDAMIAGDTPSLVPLATFNPMSREHVADRLDQLAAMGAEEVATAACAEAQARLSGLDWAVRVGLVVADDVAGGWTHRELTEARVRFTHADEYRLGWCSVLLWAGEEPTVPLVRAETLAAVARSVVQLHRGPPRTTLRAMLRQEGIAGVFAGARPHLDAAELDYTREVIRPHLDSTDYPVTFTCMYGDGAARAVGYTPMGLSHRAGFALSLVDAAARGPLPGDDEEESHAAAARERV